MSKVTKYNLLTCLLKTATGGEAVPPLSKARRGEGIKSDAVSLANGAATNDKREIGKWTLFNHKLCTNNRQTSQLRILRIKGFLQHITPIVHCHYKTSLL